MLRKTLPRYIERLALVEPFTQPQSRRSVYRRSPHPFIKANPNIVVSTPSSTGVTVLDGVLHAAIIHVALRPLGPILYEYRKDINTVHLMKRSLLDILECPVCDGDLTLHVIKEENDQIISGTLHCSSCNIDYLIEDGIPILIPPAK